MSEESVTPNLIFELVDDLVARITNHRDVDAGRG
jgi:hypothetical protein